MNALVISGYNTSGMELPNSEFSFFFNADKNSRRIKYSNLGIDSVVIPNSHELARIASPTEDNSFASLVRTSPRDSNPPVFKIGNYKINYARTNNSILPESTNLIFGFDWQRIITEDGIDNWKIICQMKELDKESTDIDGLQILYSRVEDLVDASLFESLDNLIEMFLSQEFSFQYYVGLLMITNPIRNHLSTRDKVIEEVYRAGAQYSKEVIDDTLIGLI